MAPDSGFQLLDDQDSLKHLRKYFHIPTKADLNRKTLHSSKEDSDEDQQPSIYLCGNSLGLQPTLTRKYMEQYLDTWAAKGVYGHFKDVEDSQLAPWLHVDDDVVEDMAKIVGAQPEEVAVMQTLTANLHLMLASFYRPDEKRFKIIMEGKAFPSDHYAIESHIRHWSKDPKDAMILIEPPSKNSYILPTAHILSIIDQHAAETAVLLLPGIQFYTGQFFDIPTITAHAQKAGIIVGWDLAHAVGNVPLALHDWNVDFAVWCTYKYLNCGPGSIGGCFVHQRHGQVKETPPAETGGEPKFEYQPRLAGWWGSSKSSRFAMTNQFHPIDGAAGFQLSNPSVADTTAVRASLDVFKQVPMHDLRDKSIKLSGYLLKLLDNLTQEQSPRSCFSIITPRPSNERGAQLSLLLKPGLLDPVMKHLEEAGVVVDERRPDVIRVAPAPLYNTFHDVAVFVDEFKLACEKAAKENGTAGGSVMTEGGKEAKGWSEVK